MLGTTKNGLISDPKPVPASRAGTSVAPKHRCTAFLTWFQMNWTKENLEIRLVRWLGSYDEPPSRVVITAGCC